MHNHVAPNETNAFEDMLWHSIIDLYHVPKVQIERIIQPIMAIYIEALLPKLLTANSVSSKISLITPEFPIKKSDSNRSINIDYLLADTDTLYLVELKTTLTSMDMRQLSQYMAFAQRVKGCTPAELCSTVQRIAKASRAKAKYNYLIQRITRQFEAVQMQRIQKVCLIYLLPSVGRPAAEMEQPADVTIHFFTFAELAALDIDDAALSSGWHRMRTKLPQLNR